MYIFGVILFLPVVMLDSTLYNIYLYFFADVKLQKSWPAVTEVQFRRVVTQTVRSSIVRPETRRDFVAGAVHPRRYPTLLWSRGFAGADHMTPRPVLQNSATTAALLSTV